MIFTPQNHQTKLIQSTRLNRNQHTGTLPAAQQNQKQYSRPRKKIRRNDRMMSSSRHELVIFGVDMVECTPQKHKTKDRNLKNRWGERSKSWNMEPMHHKGSARYTDNKTYDLSKERERTAQALREWREGDVNPWDLFWPANWYEDDVWAEYVEEEESKIDQYCFDREQWNKAAMYGLDEYW